jgi:hypothetical protein
MYLLGFLKEGFGNKLFMLMRYIRYFKENSKEYDGVYVAYVKSKHQEDNIFDVFPKLKEVPWLRLITWKEYDSLKKDNVEIDPTFDFDYTDFKELRQFIKKYFVFDEKYNHLLEKYDTKKGIAVHMRYGDKLQLGLDRYKRGKHPMYLVLNKNFYEDYVRKFLEEKKGPVYVFTDSPHIQLDIPGAQYVDEKTTESFFLLTKFKRAVISESTFSVAAGYMNFAKHRIICPGFKISHLTGKPVSAPYIDPDYFELVQDTSYILAKKDYALYLKK